MNIAVVGCSFAGLSFSYFLNKRLNVINLTLFDKKSKVGLSRTSACCTSVKVLNELSVEKSILRKVNSFTVHYKEEEFKFKTPNYATFDYQKLCSLLRKKIKGKFVLGNAADIRKLKKDYDIVIDSSGWSSRIDTNKRLAFGIEKEVEVDNLNSTTLHAFLGKHIIESGYGWAFPVSKNRFRVGVGSYKKLNFENKLNSFLNSLNCNEDSKQVGGFISYGLSNNIVEDNVICVGDSASQTLPLTFEGIRPAWLFSKILSQLVVDYYEGKMSFRELINNYKKSSRNKILYYTLLKSQKIFLNMDDTIFNLVKQILKSNRCYSLFSKKYFW